MTTEDCKDMKRVNMKALFQGLQRAMEVELGVNREFIAHPGSKGDAMENTWIELFRKYLPNRYSVDKAMVIDHLGNVSDQIDIVVYDNFYTPFVFRQNGFTYIPAEGVYAVFEVKPELDGNIEYAGDKIASVRRLQRTTVGMISSGRPYDARNLTKIIGGILANTCKFQKETLETHLKGLSGIKTIDMGCAEDKFAFKVEYDNERELDKTNASMDRVYDERRFREVRYSETENSLVFIVMQLSQYIQQKIGTVAALDYSKYVEASNRDECQEDMTSQE